MAFGISRVFKSTDVGAPQFAVTAGDFKNVLKAVLVNGYGSTPSLGWTLEYEVGNIAVFRMKGGTRYYIRVYDSIAGVVSGGIVGYKTMDSLNTGTERVPGIGLSAPVFRKRYDGSANVPWMIIGDDAGIIICNKDRYAGSATDPLQNAWQVCYIGDYVPFDIRNKWNFCIITTYEFSYGLCGVHKHSPSTSVKHFIQRDHSFKKGAVYCGITSLGSTTNFGQGWGSMTGGVGPAASLLGGSLYSLPIILYSPMLDTNILSTSCYNGVLPGITEPIMTDGESATTVPITSMSYSFNGPDYTQMLLYTNNTQMNGGHINIQTSAKVLVKIGKGFRNV